MTNRVRIQLEASREQSFISCLLHVGFLLDLLFGLKEEAKSSSETLVDTGLHKVISQKM
jgi:hypothetical protein